MGRAFERFYPDAGKEPIDPYLKRWMVFVDGENFIIRGQEFAKQNGIELPTDGRYQPNRFLWLTDRSRGDARWILGSHLKRYGLRLQAEAARAFYYTSVYGDVDAILQTREALWELGFTPEVFKKHGRSGKAKGVDIALTKDVLSNAFLNNYDIAVVITGDADYQPVLQEVKRLGKAVCVMAFTSTRANVNPELRLSADYFVALEDIVRVYWPWPVAEETAN